MTTNPIRSSRRGVTIIELLIVMMILLMVTAAAIPLMAPAVQNRRMREAARLASSYFSAARARAIETGRPAGVMVERFNGQNFALSLSQVEVPQPYAGDVGDARCTATVAGGPSYTESAANVPSGSIPKWVKIELPTSSFNASLIRIGDVIRFDFKGRAFTVLGPDIGPKLTNPMATPVMDGVLDTFTTPTSTLDVAYLAVPGEVVTLPWISISAPMLFQFVRQPVRSSAAPLQLPEGVVIDLVASGMGAANVFPLMTIKPDPSASATVDRIVFNPTIIFSPNGAIRSATGTSAQLIKPTGPLFFLLGRRELMDDVSKSGQDENVFDPNDPRLSPSPPPNSPPPQNLYLQNFWISIGPQTGLVTVSEVALNPQPWIAPPPNKPASIADARRFALEAQSIGGQ